MTAAEGGSGAGQLETPGEDGDARVLCITVRGKRRTVGHLYGDTRDERQQRAALIVSRVNGWDALVAERNRHEADAHRLRGALMRLEDLIRRHQEGEIIFRFRDTCEAALVAARAALEPRP